MALSVLLLSAGGGLLVAGCGPTYPNCDNDENCRQKNEVCVNKTCRQCRDDSQCTQVDPCMMCAGDNTCIVRTGCCKSDLDCPSGKCWRSPGAVVGVCGGTCDSDDNCPGGQRCVGGSCVPATTCTDDSTCAAGQKCVDGRCETSLCELQPVYFDFNEYVIRLDQEALVAANAACLAEINAPHRLEGHCDERGSDEYNLALGQRRAGGVYSQYKQLGGNPALMSTISYGEERPVCNEHNESCWTRNRRVETVRQR